MSDHSSTNRTHLPISKSSASRNLPVTYPALITLGRPTTHITGNSLIGNRLWRFLKDFVIKSEIKLCWEVGQLTIIVRQYVIFMRRTTRYTSNHSYATAHTIRRDNWARSTQQYGRWQHYTKRDRCNCFAADRTRLKTGKDRIVRPDHQFGLIWRLRAGRYSADRAHVSERKEIRRQNDGWSVHAVQLSVKISPVHH